jgi:hypothetical protein
MKNTVDEIIISFTKEELREFKYFISRRNNNIYEREDLKVISMIRKKMPAPAEHLSAYRKTKNRLKTQLELFIQLGNIKNNVASRIQNLVEVATYLFSKNLYNHAWDYLIKAERMASEEEQYELLDSIYYIQILYSYNIAVPPPAGFSVTALLARRDENLAYTKINNNANAAYALLIYEMRELFSRQLDADIDSLVNTILEKYELNDTLHKDNLNIYCKTVNIVCRALREKRDYENMKVYSINSYNLLRQKRLLEKVPANFLMDLLDAIAVAALRSKDYRNTEKFQELYTFYARKFQHQIDDYSYYDFIPYVGDTDLYLCTNRLEEAQKSMAVINKKYAGYTASIRIYFLLRINLLAVYFPAQDYSACIKTYQEIMSQNEKKILNERGFRLELMLYTEIYGVIFYYEQDDPDYAYYMLAKIKKKYAEVLKRQGSRREKLFLRILEKIINDPSYLKSNAFASEHREFILLKQFIPGDYEYISLNAWLTSKATNRTYYQCFLEIV